MAADPTKLKLVKQHSVKEICFGMSRVPGTSKLWYGASDGKVYDVDMGLEKQWVSQPHDGHAGFVTGVAIAGSVAVSGAYDGKLIWWDLAAGTPIRTVEAHQKWVRGVTASRDGKLIASVSDDMVCKIWQAETGELVKELKGHEPLTPHHYPSMLFACAFSPDGKHIATCDKPGNVFVWDVATGKKVQSLTVPLMYTWDPRQRRHSIGGPRSVAFSPDGKLLAVGGTGQIGNIDHLEANARLEIFDWQAGQRAAELVADKHKGLVEALLFHPTSPWLIATGGAGEGFLLFVDLAEKKIVHQDKVPGHAYSLALHESGDTLFLTAHGRVLQLEFKAVEPPAEKPADGKPADDKKPAEEKKGT